MTTNFKIALLVLGAISLGMGFGFTSIPLISLGIFMVSVSAYSLYM